MLNLDKFYNNFKLLETGVNTKEVRDIILDAYIGKEKQIDMLKEHNTKLDGELKDKKKIIVNLKDEIKELQKPYNLESFRLNILTQLSNDLKIPIVTANNSLFDNLKKENKTIKETNKNLLEASELYKQMIDELEYAYDNIDYECVDRLKRRRISDDVLKSSEENKTLKDENEKLKQLICQGNTKIGGLLEVNKKLEEKVLNFHMKEMHINTIREENEKLEKENKKLKQKIHEAFNRLTLYVIDRRTSSVISSHIIKAMDILE